MSIKTKIFGLIFFCSWPLLAQGENPNLILLNGGYEILLPELPSDSEQLEKFASLSIEERLSFYAKRKFVIQMLTKGVTKRGVGSGIRWTKNKIVGVARSVKQQFSPVEAATSNVELPDIEGQEPVRESQITFERVPENLNPEQRAYVESSVSGFVESMWTNSVSIARSNGIGMTFVGGVIWNTSLHTKGHVYGRSLSVDMGFNFRDNSGYMNFFYDRQSLARGGFSFDIGPMADFMVHIADPDLKRGDVIQAFHQKLPAVGSFRHGSRYSAWGAQFGLHIFEMVGAVAIVFGMPELGATLIPAVRAVGMATIYRTSLERQFLGHLTLGLDNPIMKLLGFSSYFGKLSQSRAQIESLSSKSSCKTIFAL